MCCVLLYADQDLLRMVAIACPIPFPTGWFVAPLDPFRPHPEFTPFVFLPMAPNPCVSSWAWLSFRAYLLLYQRLLALAHPYP